MAEASVHLPNWTEVHHSSQLDGTGVPHNCWRILAIAEVWVASHISDDGSNWVLIIVKRSFHVGPILIQAVAPVYTRWTQVPQLLCPHLQEEVRIEVIFIS